MKKSPLAFIKRGGAILPVVAALWAGLAAAPASAQPTATISFPSTSIVEGSGGGKVNATFRVRLSAVPSQTTTINVTTLPANASAGRTAAEDVDFDVTTAKLTFDKDMGAQATEQTFVVPVNSDDIDEPNEKFAVQITKADDSTGNVNIPTSTATATIIDDDDPPVLMVTGNNVLEGNSGNRNLIFTVSLMNSSLTGPAVAGSDVTFTYITKGQDQCVAGTDFVAASGTGTIAAGQSSTTIPVQVIGDTVDETDEQFILEISNPSNASLGTSSATGYIADDDGPVIRVTGGSVTEGGKVAFLVNLYQAGTDTPQGSPQNITLNYTTGDLGGSTDATAGKDYLASSGTVTIPAGQTGIVVYVDTIDDQVYEGGANAENPERFNFMILGAQGTPNNEGITIDEGQAYGSIIDNENKPFLTVLDTVTPELDNIVTSVKEGDTGTVTPMVFSAHLSTPSERTIFFSYQTVAGSGTGVATAGLDYETVNGTLVQFPLGQTDTTFSVNVKGDNTDEGSETLQVKLYGNNSNVDFTPSRTSSLTVTGRIADDDGDQALLSVNDPSPVIEGNVGVKSVTFRISLSKAVDYPVTVSYATQDGTATVADNDYQAVSAQKTIAAGLTGIDVPVTIVGDTKSEGNENFRLTITNSTDAEVADSDGLATITDDDAAPTVKNVLVTSGPEGTDANYANPLPDNTPFTAFPITVTLDRISGSALTYNYEVVPDSTAGFQTSGTDFRRTSGQITVPAGQSSGSVDLQIIPDDINEGDEGFIVRITDPLNNNVLLKSGKGVVANDDEGGKVSIDVADTGSNTNSETTDPFGSSLNYIVKLTPANKGTVAGQDVKVSYVVTGRTASPITPGGTSPDITRRTGTVTIPAGQPQAPLNIDIVDDTIAEKDEGLTVTITAVTSRWVADDTKDTADGTIQDNDCSITKVDPIKGFANLDRADPFSVDGDGTNVTITGTGFQIGTTPVVQSIEFGVGNPNNNPAFVPASGFEVTSATSIRVHVPLSLGTGVGQFGAVTGKIRVTTLANSALSPKDFIVQPIVRSIVPNKNVIPGSTVVTLTGGQFKDQLNPVTNLKFGGVAIDPNRALGGSFTIVDKNTITAILPDGVDPNVKVTVVTQFGGDGGASDDSISVTNASNGSVTFGDAPNTTSVFENSFVSTLISKNSPTVRNYPLQLSAAKTTNNVAVPPRGEVVVKVTIADSLPANSVLRISNPVIASPAARAEVKSGSEIEFTFPAGALPSYQVSLVDSGDDYIQPNFVAGGAFLQRAPDTQLTLTATIVRSADPLYPVGATKAVTFNRIDPRGLVFPVETTFRTDEDANSATHTARFVVGLLNDNPTNPDGTTNTEWVPRADVTVPVKTSDTSEGLLSYYVRKPGSSTLIPIQAIPQAVQQVNFLLDPKSDEYYRNEHVIVVTGQDDKIQDGDIRYNVLVGDTVSTNQVFSADQEYQFTIPSSVVQLVNGDNEQVDPTDPTDPTQPGFIFSTATGVTTTPAITTSENGTTDFFTVRLRKQPTGPVKLRVRTTNPDEGRLVDPTDPTGKKLVDSYDVIFRRNDPKNPGPQDSRYDKPLTITVQGIDDVVQDGNKNFLIQTDTIDADTADSEYARIDPVDVSVTNTDNESTGVTVTPTRLTVTENASDVFSVRLNKKPTANVIITVVSTDPSTAKVTKNRLTFTPTTGQAIDPPTQPGTQPATTSGWNVPQPVRVTGVQDFIASNTPRTATIQLTLSSTDTAYNAIDPADVDVSVLDADTAGFNLTPEGIQTISENGGVQDLALNLKSKPTADVSYTFSSSNTAKARFEVDGAQVDTVTLTFTSNNFNVPQTLRVVGVDNDVKDDASTLLVRVTSTVNTTDPAYASASTPVKRFNVTDDETSGGGGTGGATLKTFAAGTSYAISFPYMPGSGIATDVGTPNQIFDRAMVGPNNGHNYWLYYYKANTQTGSLLPIGQETESGVGSDNYIEVKKGETLVRGKGYILKVGASTIGLLAKNANIVPLSAATFTVTLRTNTSFTGGATRNGLNLIGFPFDAKAYKSITLEKCDVAVTGSNGTTVTKSFAEAVGAGWVNGDMFSVDPVTGHLTKLPSGSHTLNALESAFVQTYVDGAKLILKNPTPVGG